MANKPFFMFGATFPPRGKPAPTIFREGRMTRTKNSVLGLINTSEIGFCRTSGEFWGTSWEFWGTSWEFWGSSGGPLGGSGDLWGTFEGLVGDLWGTFRGLLGDLWGKFVRTLFKDLKK